MWEAEQQRRPLDYERFDVAVIGGGINGVAIARQCAAAGRRTLLIEQHDFASGTTGRSTRIIHGGLRYLEHGELGLVRESLRERERLLRTRPHLVRPMRFLLALPTGRRSALEVRFGLWLYRRFAPDHAKARNGHGTLALERALDRGQPWHVFQYDDAQCEFPERLVAEWLSEAHQAGAEVRNYTQALEVETAHGRVRGLRLRDRLSSIEYRVQSRWVINASGPWADSVATLAGVAGERMVGGVRGSHIVLPRFTGAPESAVYTEAADGRPFFVIPWNEQLLVGTTEVADAGDPGQARPSDAEIAYLLRSVQQLFPSVRLRPEDVRYAMAGVRPLPFSPGRPLPAVTRRHLLCDHAGDGASGMISVVGGKLTNAASVARECARKIGIEAAEPRFDAVVGDGDLTAVLDEYAAAAGMSGLGNQAARAVVSWFGRGATHIARCAARDGRLRQPICDASPHIVAEAVYAIRREFAATLADILLRRVPVALAGWWSEEPTRQAAERIGGAMGWNNGRIAREIENFQQERGAFLVQARERQSIPA